MAESARAIRMPTAPETSARAARLEPLIRLATGGMAEIWLARELGAAGLERFVVIKRLLPHLANDPGIVDMFVSEARFVARLVHPNVVQIHELAEDEQGYFLVMEYVAGCSVRELMSAATKAYRTLPPSVAICIIEQACRGAHAAHELSDSSGEPLGLVHRDISPHNLMIAPGGDVKLLDFGIAKATAAADATRTGSLKGKCTYMSPEQCQARSIDRRSDIFSLGIVLWELLVGERLFQRDSEFASMEAIVSGEIPLPSEERPELPVALDAVVAKALAKDPDDRWQTADALRRGLIAVADRHNLRPSRDGLAAELSDLLGDRLTQRQEALRDTGRLTAEGDHAALQEMLMGSNPHAHHSVSKVTGRTASTADDAPTVVQRGSVRPPAAAQPPADDEDATVAQTNPDREPTRASPAADPVTPSPPPLPKKRGRLIVAALGVVVAVAVVVAWRLDRVAPTETGHSDVDAGAVLSGPPLRFTIPPTVEPDVIVRELAPFKKWLEGELTRPVEIQIADSYEDCGTRVADNRAEIGLLPPLLFVQTRTREPKIRAVVLRLYDGSRGSDGYLLVREDATFKTAADLRGQAVCLVDRESTTGYLLPRIWMREAGLDPDVDVRTVLSGDHLAAMRDLAKKKCEAAAVYSGAYLSARQQGIAVGTMRVMEITGRVPQDVIVASPEMPEADLARLRDLLLHFEPQRDIGSPRVGTVLGISGFAAYDAKEFDLIQKAAEREGIVPVPAP